MTSCSPFWRVPDGVGSRSRRGLTLLETLVALALLGALAVACATAVELASRQSPAIARRLEWTLAAQALLGQLQDDLTVHDAGLGFSDSTPRAVVDRESLRVRTRAIRARERRPPLILDMVEYRFDPARGIIARRLLGVDGRVASSTAVDPPLLSEIASWSCAWRDDGRRLVVELTSLEGTSVSRSFIIE